MKKMDERSHNWIALLIPGAFQIKEERNKQSGDWAFSVLLATLLCLALLLWIAPAHPQEIAGAIESVVEFVWNGQLFIDLLIIVALPLAGALLAVRGALFGAHVLLGAIEGRSKTTDRGARSPRIG